MSSPPPPPRSLPPPPPPRRFGSTAPSPQGVVEAPPPPKGRSPLFWIAVGCVGCVTLPFLLFALLAGTVGGGFFYFARQPALVVRSQLAELRAGKLDEAYLRLSDDYRARLTRAEFAALVEAHVTLRDNADVSFWNRTGSPGQMHLGGTLTSRSGVKEAVEYDLTRFGRQWKITAISFPTR